MTPYEAGFDAAQRGFGLKANPFTSGTKNYSDWECGWYAYWKSQ